MQWLTVKGRARGPGRFSIAVSVLLLIMPLQLAYCRINMPLHELSIQIYHWKDGEPNTETATIKLMRARGIMEEGVEENATEFVPLVGPIKNVPRGKRQTGRQALYASVATGGVLQFTAQPATYNQFGCKKSRRNIQDKLTIREADAFWLVICLFLFTRCHSATTELFLVASLNPDFSCH